MSWADKIKQITQKDKLKTEQWLRAAIIQGANVAMIKSPVGNPDLWIWDHPQFGYVDYVTYKGYPEGYVGGQFRANWRVSIGNLDGTIKDTTNYGAENAGVVDDILGFRIGETVTVSNPMPYGPRLEYDQWSTQAPDGMVRPAVKIINKALNKKVSE